MQQICSDLEAQYREFDDLVAGLSEGQWHRKTAFYGWTVFDQVAHIAFFDHEALLAAVSPDTFKKRTERILNVIHSDGSWPACTNPLLGPEKPAQLLALWRHIRSRLILRLRGMSAKGRLPWYGPDMSARSLATARLMETWAHSQDVFDTLGIGRSNFTRLRHVAHMGVYTFAWSFKLRKLPVPDVIPRVELAGPAGEQWSWGDPEACERVWGRADQFCLVVTQRRNIEDTDLNWQGVHVAKWLRIAQAFAGVPQIPPGPGMRV